MIRLSLRWLSVFRLLAALVVGLSVVVPQAQAETPEYYEQIFLAEADALKLVLGDLELEKRQLKPTAAQRQALQKRLRRKVEETHFNLYLGKRKGRVERYALICEEKGKHFPITFIVGLNPQGNVTQVAVMVYRERRGDGVKRKRFLNQFVNKGPKDALEVNTDIIHITGSTISSWSIAAGVRKAVAVLDLLVLHP